MLGLQMCTTMLGGKSKALKIRILITSYVSTLFIYLFIYDGSHPVAQAGQELIM